MSRTARERFAALRQSFWRHPRITSVTRAARGVYASGLSYCADAESDGFIPERIALVMLAEGYKRDVVELVAAGLWASVEGGYQVVAYLEHNKSKADMQAAREKMGKGGAKGGGSNRIATMQPTEQGTLLPTKHGESKAEAREGEGEGDLPLSPPGVIGSPQARVAMIIAGPATPQRAWQLLEAIAELHPGSNGRPVASPGLMPSENDKTKLGKLLGTIQGEEPLGYVAGEWLALLSLIDAGEMERPKGPMVPYFIACFGRLEDRRREEGVPHLPARTEAAA